MPDFTAQSESRRSERTQRPAGGDYLSGDYLISDLPGACAHCGFFHSSAICPPNLSGRALYEADLKARPNYHTGEPRKTWEQLSDVARASWERTTHEQSP